MPVDQSTFAEVTPAERRATKRAKLEQTAYGNYSGYHSRRRLDSSKSTGDPRLALLPADWVDWKRVLDIGCNSGRVTVELAQSRRPYRITGVDIDPELVRFANKHVRVEWSRMAPLATIQAAANELDRSSKRKREDETNGHADNGSSVLKPIPRHFPSALPRMFGLLPYPPPDLLRTLEDLDDEEQKARARPGGRGKAMPREIRIFPDNIKFRSADWVEEDIEEDRKGYDLILAFSITKWIHLNGGDRGMRDFFAKVFEVLKPDGRFVVEPQPWSSYEKARKMTDELSESYAKLELRPDDFERILLEDIGFKSVQHLGTVGEGGFARPVHAYIKAGGSFI